MDLYIPPHLTLFLCKIRRSRSSIWLLRIPTPLSVISMINFSSSSLIIIEILSALAYRATLVSASCNILNTTVAFSWGKYISAFGIEVSHLIPVLLANSSACHSMAAIKPSSSRIPGLSFEVIFWPV